MRIFHPIISGSLIQSGSSVISGSLSVLSGITGSLYGTASWSQNSITASFASTASYLNTLNQDLIFNGNLTLNGTASIEYLNVIYETASVIYSSGSNQFGDATDDIQTLIGRTIISGTLEVTGSSNLPNITGSLFGTASWSNNSATASYSLQSISASFAATASSVNPLNQNVIVNGAVTSSFMLISGSGGNVNRLLVVGSGSNIPLFTVQGSQGELFSITDSLSGSLFSVNDISGLPVIEAFSDGKVTLGSTANPALITTVKVTSVAGNNTIYSVPTASYDGVWFDYTVKSGSNARAGQIMSIWNGNSVSFTETTTTDIGSTSDVNFTSIISGANLLITGSTSTANWTIKGIVRSI